MKEEVPCRFVFCERRKSGKKIGVIITVRVKIERLPKL